MAKKKITKISKTLWIVIAIIVIIIIGMAIPKIFRHILSQSTSATTSMINSSQSMTFDFLNQKIMLNNQELTFANGSYTNSDGQLTANITNQSVSQSDTRAAAIVVDNPEGSGTFYYLIGAMRKDRNKTYSQPVQLGDRIKIESVSVNDPQTHNNGEIIVQYLDRAANAPMASEPTIQMTKKFAFENNGNLIEVLH